MGLTRSAPLTVLVLFHSRTETTRRLAETIRRAFVQSGAAADLERLEDYTHRGGAIGWLRALFESLFGWRSELRSLAKNPTHYDAVVIGSPVWNLALATPVRVYLRERPALPKTVAFFSTSAGLGGERVFAEMRRLSGVSPVACLSVHRGELGRAESAVERLVAEVLTAAADEACAPGAVPSPEPRVVQTPPPGSIPLRARSFDQLDSWRMNPIEIRVRR